MAVEIQVDQMTVEEKLQAMEVLWDALRQNEADVPVPQWHKDLLDEREARLQRGETKFIDWETAKRQISDRIK